MLRIRDVSRVVSHWVLPDWALEPGEDHLTAAMRNSPEDLLERLDLLLDGET